MLTLDLPARFYLWLSIYVPRRLDYSVAYASTTPAHLMLAVSQPLVVEVTASVALEMVLVLLVVGKEVTDVELQRPSSFLMRAGAPLKSYQGDFATGNPRSWTKATLILRSCSGVVMSS
ncbi:hypothetical protein CVT26_013298 [Gymnopilus dilepis]|uniref:Uncharacterized protein n=1 Tax=Gymnopilus dilepis TaxID=231916 RepID=A0A409VUN5_9AGAR|nr:hypothetical protein CVT26_013298 [Gymnopilus dilepis]